MAAILTGWSANLNPASPKCGTVMFNPRRHEAGAKTLLGQKLPDEGPDQLRRALTLLANHPSTAHNVSTRMLRGFVGDSARPADIATLSRSFQKSQGDLREVTRTMLSLDAI